MEERCKICNSIINEIIIFNGETKYFCSISCSNMEELVLEFKDFVQNKIDKYQYLHRDTLVDFLCPINNKMAYIRNFAKKVFL